MNETYQKRVRLQSGGYICLGYSANLALLGVEDRRLLCELVDALNSYQSVVARCTSSALITEEPQVDRQAGEGSRHE